MVYQWKSGARISADPQVAGDMCKKLEAEGRLTAKELLNENRPEDAPLHKEFEWNDSIAAESWREQQARHIINSLIVCPEKADPVRVFFKIERTENRYQSIETILEHKDSTRKLMENALQELESIQRKYNAIKQLKKVWDAISEAKEAAS